MFPILVGTQEQARVPRPAGLFGDRIEYVEVEYPIDPELLRTIAEKTGGTFYTAEDREALEKHFHEILERFEKTRIRDLANALKTELFPAMSWTAFLLLLLAAGLELTVLRRFP